MQLYAKELNHKHVIIINSSQIDRKLADDRNEVLVHSSQLNGIIKLR